MKDSFIENKDILVTGGGGFLGRAVCRLLIKEKCNVRSIGRNSYPEIEALGVKCYKGDIRLKEDLEKAARGCFAIIHIAAFPGIWGKYKDYYSINYMGTQNVVALCKKLGIENLVYTSTPSVIYNQGGIKGKKESELSYPKNFQCHYAKTKAMAEELVIQSAGCSVENNGVLKTVSLRPHLIWGPGDKNLIPRLLERGRKKKLKIVGNGQNKVDVVYIDNAALAHITALNKLVSDPNAINGKAYFITQQKPVIMWDFLNEILQKSGIQTVNKKVSYKVAYSAGWILELLHGLFFPEKEPVMTRFLAEQFAKDHYFNPQAAREELGYIPDVSTAQGVGKLIAWIKKEKL